MSKDHTDINVLFVDDEQSVLSSIKRELNEETYNKHFATSGKEALIKMEETDIAIIITDIKMPEMTGLELLTIIQDKYPDTVRIILTGYAQVSSLISAINSGQVYRYLTKPWKLEEEFIPAIRHAIDYYLVLKERKTLLEELKTKNIELNEHNIILKDLSSKDGLTGVYNHRYFQEEIKRQFAIAKRNETDLCLLLIDIDHFKKINDNYGHSFGDLILKELTHTISKVIRESDFFARYGGEEFVILLPTTGIKGGNILAETIRAKIKNTEFSDKNNSIKITVSIGIDSISNSDSKSPSIIFEHADKAMYKAKEMGRNKVCIFENKKSV